MKLALDPKLLSRLWSSIPSTYAAQVDSSFNAGVVASLLIFVSFLLLLFFVRIRPPQHPEAHASGEGLSRGVVAWTAGAGLIAAGYFGLGYRSVLFGLVVPADALEIRAVSEHGRWHFEYPTGEVSSDVLAVPRSKAVRLLMSSADQLHDIYLPEFRLAETAIPGRYTSLWFQGNDLVSVPIRCRTFCATRGDNAAASMTVLEPSRFEEWLSATRKTQSVRVAEAQGTR